MAEMDNHSDRQVERVGARRQTVLTDGLKVAHGWKSRFVAVTCVRTRIQENHLERPIWFLDTNGSPPSHVGCAEYDLPNHAHAIASSTRVKMH